MFRNAIRTPILVGLVMVSLLVGAVFAQLTHVSQGQSEAAKTLKNHLIELRDSHASAYIGFKTSLDGISPGWAVPESFENEEGEKIASRHIGEVGEDFVCIKTNGQGIIFTDCIPFSNIAYISQPAP